MKSFEGVFATPISGRSVKPRKTGYTMVIDKGLGLQATRDLMDTAADYIDSLKQTFGTSAFFDERLMRQKIEIVRAAGVNVYPGGTFLEIAVWQGKVQEYLSRVKELGFTGVEVSDGTIEMSDAQRHDAIKRAVDMGFLVISEVGKKDPSDKVAYPKMHEDIKNDLELGVHKVIVEARESGKGVGIFDASGNPDGAEVDAIISGVKDPNDLIWEAPLKNQHVWLIKRFGINVNLGNVPPEEVLVLEALRNGMRGDTLKMAYLGKVR
ncbi:MAG: phosphosulfolactate synthase [Sphingomonadaceae bacterium]